MPRIQHLVNAFTSGELSPRLRGRVDLAKYHAGLECLHNYLILPQGGVTRRPGLRFVEEAGQSDGCVRLVSFEPTSASAYVIELGCTYSRFYKNNVRINHPGGAAFTVTTPYTSPDLFGIQKVPSIDVLYLLHPSYQTRKLERHQGDACWKLRVVPFAPPPSLEVGTRPSADFSVSAVSGDGVTATGFNCAAFVASDVGREILLTGGCNAGARAGIASVTSAQVAVVNVCVPFVNTNVNCIRTWKITGSPLTGVTPGAHTAVGKATTLTADANAWRGGINAFGQADGDCGKFVLLNGGVFRITAVTSATVAQAIIEGTATPATAAKAESGNWTLEEALFSDCNGWAAAGTFHDSRFYLAAGHRFAGSKSGDYENFAPGSVDDDGVLFALDSETLETIQWMRGRKSLLIGTISGEWEAIGSTDAPITATNIQVKKETNQGSSGVPPVQAGPAVLFIGRGGRQIRELAFVFEVDSFQAPDLLLLAEHLTRRSTAAGTDPTIVDAAYQRRPDPRLWLVRSDGVLLCCTYLRDQNIVAWSRLTTNGSFESVAVIAHPNGDRDQVWVAVRRTINSVVKRYIEYFDDTGGFYPTLNVDAAYVCTSSQAFNTFCGLSHLECSTVQIVADGSVRPSTTVVGGNISFDSPCATKVEVGLAYTSDLVMMRPEVPVGGQSSMPAKLSWVRIVIKLLDTLGMILGTASGEEIVPFRTAVDCMGSAPALFSGDKEIGHLGWDNAQVIIRQTQPLPSTVLAITGVLDVGSA